LMDGYCSGDCNVLALCACVDGTLASGPCPVNLPMACQALCAEHRGWCQALPPGSGSCASNDAGTVDAGNDGGAPNSGPADAGVLSCGNDGGACDLDQLCFAVTSCGGAVGACSTTYTCQPAGSCSENETCACFKTQEPCEGSALCSVDGGAVACQFDFP
jgi:hypothetical protein